MKRKAEDLDYEGEDSDSGSDSDSDSFPESGESGESEFYSDSEIDYQPQREMILILNNVRNDHPVVNNKNRKKTKIDKKREQILEQIKNLSNDNYMKIEDKVLFSGLKLEHKAELTRELAQKLSGTDRVKYINYIEKVLKIPFGKYNYVNFKNHAEFMVSLKENLDKSIYGHKETKEEIIDYINGRIKNPDYNSNILALQSEPGFGKCLSKDTLILMYDGSLKKVQEVIEGDILMGDDSTPRNVLTLGRGKDIMYKITHSKTRKSYTVNSEHILVLEDSRDGSTLEISVKEFYKLPKYIKHIYRGFSNSIEFYPESNSSDPLTDGCEFDITRSSIPDIHKLSRRHHRINFLSGLVDQIGIYSSDKVQLFPNNDAIIGDLMFIIDSLGFTASLDVVNNIKIISIIDNLPYIKFPEMYSPITSREDISIEKLKEDEYYGFTINGNRRFVLGNMIVTHNTRFIRALGKTLNIPFNQISFGGMNDTSTLLGHDYTYIGSKPGKIYETLAKSKCMNPIIYLDEIDKIGELGSQKTTEINGILTHLLDKEQNMEFSDNYLGNINLDLSRVLFIVSFNNPYNVDPVVLNRLKVIKIKESTENEKIEIVKKFTIPEICKNLKIKENINIEDSIIKYIIRNKVKSDKGMRSINNVFSTLYAKINTLLSLQEMEKDIRLKIIEGLSYENIILEKPGKELTITINLVDSLLHREEKNISHLSMYN